MALKRPNPFTRGGRRLPGQSSDEDLGLERALIIKTSEQQTIINKELIMMGNIDVGNYLEITPAGIKLFANSTAHTFLQADGDTLIGEDITSPGKTYFLILANAQSYNTESLGAGDMLIGDNSTAKANILWDKSAGQMLFRGGKVTQLTLDTDGSLTAGGATFDSNGISIDGGNVILDSSGLVIAGVLVIDGDGINLGSGEAILDQNGIKIDEDRVVMDSNGINLGSGEAILDHNGISIDNGGVILDAAGLTVTGKVLVDANGITIGSPAEVTMDADGIKIDEDRVVMDSNGINLGSGEAILDHNGISIDNGGVILDAAGLTVTGELVLDANGLNLGGGEAILDGNGISIDNGGVILDAAGLTVTGKLVLDGDGLNIGSGKAIMDAAGIKINSGNVTLDANGLTATDPGGPTTQLTINNYGLSVSGKVLVDSDGIKIGAGPSYEATMDASGIKIDGGNVVLDGDGLTVTGKVLIDANGINIGVGEATMDADGIKIDGGNVVLDSAGLTVTGKLVLDGDGLKVASSDVVLDADGLTIQGGTGTSNKIIIEDSSTTIGEIYSRIDSNVAQMFITSKGKDATDPDGYVEVVAQDYTAGTKLTFSLDSANDRGIMDAEQFLLGESIRLAGITTTNRNNLPQVNGTIVYNTTTSKFQGYAGGSWVDLH